MIESILDESEFELFLKDYLYLLYQCKNGESINANFALQLVHRLGEKSDFDSINIQIETIISNVYEKVQVYDFKISIENTPIVLTLEEMIRIAVSTAISNSTHDNAPNFKKDLITYYTYKSIVDYTQLIPNQFTRYKRFVIVGIILSELGYGIINSDSPTNKDYYWGISKALKRILKERGED